MLRSSYTALLALLAIAMLSIPIVDSQSGYTYVYAVTGGDGYYAVVLLDSSVGRSMVKIYSGGTEIRSREFTGIYGIWGGIYSSGVFYILGFGIGSGDSRILRIVSYGVDGVYGIVDLSVNGTYYAVSRYGDGIAVSVRNVDVGGLGTYIHVFSCGVNSCSPMSSAYYMQRYPLQLRPPSYVNNVEMVYNDVFTYNVLFDGLDLLPRLCIQISDSFSCHIIDTNRIYIDFVAYAIDIGDSNLGADVYVVYRYSLARYICTLEQYCSKAWEISLPQFSEPVVIAPNVNGNGVSVVFMYGAGLHAMKYDSGGNVVSSASIPSSDRPVYVYDSGVTYVAVIPSGFIGYSVYGNDVNIDISVGSIPTVVTQTVTVPGPGTTVTETVTTTYTYSLFTTTTIPTTVHATVTVPTTVYTTVAGTVTVPTTVYTTFTTTKTVGVESPVTIPTISTVTSYITVVTVRTVGYTTITSPWRAVVPIVTTISSVYTTTTTTTVYPISADIANIIVVLTVLAIVGAAIAFYILKR